MILEEMTWPAFIAGLEKTRTVIVPMGALEEHGGHLPLGTDTLHMEALARAAADRAPVFVAPAIHYGLCRSTAGHPGTVTLRFDTLRALIRDVGQGLYRQGLRRLILASGHAGLNHRAAMVEAAEELMALCPDLIVAALTVVDLLKDQVADVLATPGDAHAGELETAIGLHLFPDWVHGRSPRETPRFHPTILVRNPAAWWPGGVWGDPAAATAEKGNILFERGVAALVRLVGDIETFTEKV